MTAKIESEAKNQELLSTLMELGLSRSQSRVFITLALSGRTTAHDISRFSGVSRPDTYRSLSELVDLGLIEKAISSPTTYRPLSVSEVIAILLERREKRNDEIVKKASKYLNLNAAKEPEFSSSDNQFIFVPAHGAMDIKVDKLAMEVQREICVMLTLSRLLPWLERKTVQEALDRGVHLRAITEKPAGAHIHEVISRIQNNPLVEFRFLVEQPSVCFGYYDNKVVLFTISVSRVYWKSPGIWSSNYGLIELARSYFNSAWTQL